MANDGMFAGLYLKFDPEIVFQIDELRNQIGVIIRKMATKEQLDAFKVQLDSKLNAIDTAFTNESEAIRTVITSLETKVSELSTQLAVPVNFTAELERLDMIATNIEAIIPAAAVDPVTIPVTPVEPLPPTEVIPPSVPPLSPPEVVS